jgi:hypothetical protein
MEEPTREMYINMWTYSSVQFHWFIIRKQTFPFERKNKKVLPR